MYCDKRRRADTVVLVCKKRIALCCNFSHDEQTIGQHIDFYSYESQEYTGKPFSFAPYRGKVSLVVNTATGCRFTPQYKELQSIYEDYHDRGFEIFDFSCNQFREEAPGSNAEINEFCEVKYATTFPRMAKADVNGAHAIPLFGKLDKCQPFTGFGLNLQGFVLSKVGPIKKGEPGIRWNFIKFLIDKTGDMVARFEPTVSMEKVREAIEKLL